MKGVEDIKKEGTGGTGLGREMRGGQDKGKKEEENRIM
jgi:hypothetical protein